MEQYSDALRIAFVEAYPRYVAGVLAARGIRVDDVIADAIIEGAQVLDGLLTTLGSTPPDQQRQSPLELFRESLRPVVRALDTVGVAEVPRDPAQQALIPWDRFALTPASAMAIGTGAHDAHIAWGVAKTAALGQAIEMSERERPLLWFAAREGDAAGVVAAGERAGYDVRQAPQWDWPVAVLIDLAVHNSDELIDLALGDGHRIVAYDDVVEDLRELGLKAAGVWKVASRDDVLHRLGTILPVLG